MRVDWVKLVMVILGCTVGKEEAIGMLAAVQAWVKRDHDAEWKRWTGWLLSRLGAFPIRRGQSDETEIEAAQLITDRGGTVVIFPEGTRIRTGSLGRPKRGVGRLALETGAPVLPAAR